MKKSFLNVILNILSAVLGILIIWFVTDKSLFALIVVLLSAFFGSIGMLFHYQSRVQMFREELPNPANLKCPTCGALVPMYENHGLEAKEK